MSTNTIELLFKIYKYIYIFVYYTHMPLLLHVSIYVYYRLFPYSF